MPQRLAELLHAGVAQVVVAQVQELQAPAGAEHGAEVGAAGAREPALPQAAGEVRRKETFGCFMHGPSQSLPVPPAHPPQALWLPAKSSQGGTCSKALLQASREV